MSYLLLLVSACATSSAPPEAAPAGRAAPAAAVADDDKIPDPPVPPPTANASGERMAGGPGGPPGADLDSKTNQLGLQPAFTTNPTSQAQVAWYLDVPTTGTAPYPTLVFANGALHAASEELKPNRTEPYLRGGFAIAYFDADGRGNSGGTEDQNGAITQDGFAQVIREVAKDPRVDPKRIGVVSYSFGVAIATGALARHTDLPVQFYIDWEGPSNREYISGCGATRSDRPQPGKGSVQWGDCNDDKYWKQRESAEWIGKIKVPYWRLQFTKDHVQPDYGHTLLMVNAAEKAGVRVRLNDMGDKPKVKTDSDIVTLDNTTPNTFKILEYARTWMIELTGATMPELPPAPHIAGGGARTGGPPGRGPGRPRQ